jgi:hypothetical protein
MSERSGRAHGEARQMKVVAENAGLNVNARGLRDLL